MRGTLRDHNKSIEGSFRGFQHSQLSDNTLIKHLLYGPGDELTTSSLASEDDINSLVSNSEAETKKEVVLIPNLRLTQAVSPDCSVCKQ